MKYLILKISTLLACILALSLATVQAQPKRAKVIQIPMEFIKPIGGNTNGVKGKLSATGPKNDWVVHSDRDNNLTYVSSNSDNKNKTMNFMENFYVIGETDTRVELIKYDPTVVSASASRKVNMKKAEYYGWAEKSKLLLWNNSLVNKQTDFTIKALVGHSITDMVKGISTEKQLTLYNSPTIEANTENDNDVRLFEFLYVFKEENNKYLIGISNELSRSIGSQEVIKGWISEKNAQIWSQRLCIEPNDEQSAATERRKQNIKASLFNNYQGALAFKTGTTAKYEKVLWDKDKYELGYPASWKRIPVISKLEGVYKTGVITDVYSKNNRKVLTAEEHARLEAQYNAVRDKKQNINMVFVIDGTQSNHSFFVPIINSIENSINLLKNSDKKYKIGTVIYGKSGQGIVDSHPLTSKHSSVIQSLKNYRGKKDIAQDNDEPTDLYEGIRKATRTLNPKQTNIIILIGDAGSSVITGNAHIIQRMKDTECGLICFQTRNVKGQAGRIYNEFFIQTKELILQSSIRSGIRPTLYEDSGNTFRLRYPIESLLPGSLTYSDKGGAMSQEELEEEIRTMLASFEKQHDRLLQDLDCEIYIDCKPGINEAILEYIFKEIPDIDPATLRKIGEMDHQLFVEAYAPMVVDGLEHPLFKHVIFLTRQEFNELEEALNKVVYIGNTPSELRKEIINAYKQILIGYYGTEVKQEIANKTPAEIMEIVIGLPTTSELLGKYTIAELGDHRKVNDEEIRDIFFYIDKKLQDLRNIIGNPAYFFRSRDQTYYWVPQEVLP